MSEVLAHERPMAGLDSTFGRLRPSLFEQQADGDLLAELLRIIADHVESHGEAEPRKDGAGHSMRVAPDQIGADAGKPAGTEEPAGSGDCATPTVAPIAPAANGDEKRTIAQVPRIGGDFAAIEAGLLGGLDGDNPAASQTGPLSAAPSAEAAPERRCEPGNNQLSSKRNGPRAGVYRTRYLIAGLAAAGFAGAAFNIFGGPLLGGPERAVSASNTAEVPETDTPGGSTSAVLEAVRRAAPSVEPEAPVALAAMQRGISSVPEAETAGPLPKAPEPVSAAAPAGADAPQAVAARPESAAAPAGADVSQAVAVQPESPHPASAALAQDTSAASPPPAQQQAGAVNDSGTKAAVEPVKPPAAHKARHSASQGQQGHQGHAGRVTKSAKASSPGESAAGPASGAQTKTEMPAGETRPVAEAGPSAKDPLAAVQGALSSLASAAAKLFEQPAR